jgi:archaellum biogenesis ATPase FlaH
MEDIENNLKKQIENYEKSTKSGYISVIFGPESSGKSAISLKIIAEYQKQGKRAVYFDVEHTFDTYFADIIGVNTDDLVVLQQLDVLKAIEMVLRTKTTDLLVIDTFTAMNIDWHNINFILDQIDRLAKMFSTEVLFLDQRCDGKRNKIRSSTLHQVAQVIVYLDEIFTVMKAGDPISTVITPYIIKSFHPQPFLGILNVKSLKLDFRKGFI